MVLPIGDDNRDRRTFPFVNYLLIGFNIFVFIYWQRWGHNVQLTYSYATVPAEIISGHDIVTHSKILIDADTGQRMVLPGLGVTPIPVFLTLFTSMFMHGGLLHLLGNMLFLIPVPALVAVGIWFAFQIVDGLGMLGGRQTGNVAYAAHIGGFVFGLLLTRLFAGRRYRRNFT